MAASSMNRLWTARPMNRRWPAGPVNRLWPARPLRLWTAPRPTCPEGLPSRFGGPGNRGGAGSGAPGRRLAAVLLVGAGVLALAGCDPGPRERQAGGPASTSSLATSGGTCEPTKGEATSGRAERLAAADAPATGRLGPGGEVERTAETVAAGRGGERLVVEGTVYRADCRTPLAGASVAVWQTNAAGEYGPGQGTSGERCCYLAAALRTDQRGRYRFETVKPGHYKGEAEPPPAHIHFEVQHPDATGLLTELLFEGDPRLQPGALGEVVAPTPVPGSNPPQLRARFDIVLRP
jgi:protocatechuate 3,4-dioxygenase beta subunit